MLLTDYFVHTVENLQHNVDSNAAVIGAHRASVQRVDWANDSTYALQRGQFDIVLGCDLTYDVMAVPPLLDAVMTLLRPGGVLFYVAGGAR